MEQDRRRNPEQEGIGTVSDQEQADVFGVLDSIRRGYTEEELARVIQWIGVISEGRDDKQNRKELDSVKNILSSVNSLRISVNQIDTTAGLNKGYVRLALAAISGNPENVKALIEKSEQGFDKIIDSDGRGRLEP